jgi:hypothetical protein
MSVVTDPIAAFEAAVAEELQRGQGQARSENPVSAVVRKNPKLHAAYVAAVNKHDGIRSAPPRTSEPAHRELPATQSADVDLSALDRWADAIEAKIEGRRTFKTAAMRVAQQNPALREAYVNAYNAADAETRQEHNRRLTALHRRGEANRRPVPVTDED